jgi:hypothetical protein
VRLIRLEEGDQLSGLERIDGLAGDADTMDGEANDGTDGEQDSPPTDDTPADS